MKLKPSNDWYKRDAETVLYQLQTSNEGLNDSEANKRIEEYGTNEITGGAKKSALQVLLAQFNNLVIYILVASAVVSIILGKTVEPIAIMVIVVLAGLLGFFQEFQANKAIESLKKMAAPLATILRNGLQVQIPAKDIVPGDIVFLKAGDKIPADIRILESASLRVEEAPLTGESNPVEKSIAAIPGADVTIGDRVNMAYMGTTVVYGRGKGVVAATGMATEFGKIATLLSETEERKTPLQENIDSLGKKLGIFAVVVSVIVGIVELFLVPNDLTLQERVGDTLLWVVSLAVAIIPEALPAVVTITLALGVRRMVQRNALIRKLQAVETLGAVTVICSDKTGTLTQDKMSVREAFIDGITYTVEGKGYNPNGIVYSNGNTIDYTHNKALEHFLIGSLLCNDSKLTQNEDVWEIVGDPTEGGLVVFALRSKLIESEIQNRYPRVHEIPFSSDSKRMTTVHSTESGSKVAFAKGAAEVIIEACTKQLKNGEIVPLTAEEKQVVINKILELGNKALRVLGVSMKTDVELGKEDAYYEKEMVFLGIAGMIDPPRQEAAEAIRVAKEAGIKPIMITGDHKITAAAIARELGILTDGRVVAGTELEHLSDDEIRELCKDTQVFARISPEHKLKIVNGFISLGNIVAMTGDGVNDAPALKKSDIGVAMGIAGTDVTKEAAEMILTDDNFASIVNAVEEGRSIFENIRKYLVFLLSGNMGTVLAIIIAMVVGFIHQPILAVQILFINFIMDGILAIALGVEMPEKGIMKRKPRNVKEGILNRHSLILTAVLGTVIALVSIGMFAWQYNLNRPTDVKDPNLTAITMFFITLIFARLFNAINCRSLNDSSITIPFSANKALLPSIGAVIALTGLMMFIEPLQNVMRLTSIDPNLIGYAFLAGSLTLVAGEILKLVLKRA